MLSRRLLREVQALCSAQASEISLPDLVMGFKREIFPSSPLPTDGPQGTHRIPAIFALTEENVVDILQILAANAHLESLDMSNLHLTFLPETVGNLPGLRHLFLGSNVLQSIPESISKLQRLETLDLRNKELSKNNLNTLS